MGKYKRGTNQPHKLLHYQLMIKLMNLYQIIKNKVRLIKLIVNNKKQNQK